MEKFKYLKNYLAGPALRLAEGYDLSNDNYEMVKEALKERFGNPQRAISKHLSAFLEVPAADNTIERLQDMYDQCEVHIRSWVALKMEEETFGRVFVEIILQKLPSEVKTALHLKNGAGVWTLATLRKSLSEQIMARIMGEENAQRGCV